MLKVLNSNVKIYNTKDFDEKNLTVEGETTEILHEKSKEQKYLA